VNVGIAIIFNNSYSLHADFLGCIGSGGVLKSMTETFFTFPVRTIIDQRLTIFILPMNKLKL